MQDLETRFGEAAHGVRWALGWVSDALGAEGARRVQLLAPKIPAGDSFEIAWGDGGLAVAAGTAVGAIGGLLEAARQARAGRRRDLRQDIRFKTRVYKHEVQWEGRGSSARGAHADSERPIGRYSDAFLEAFFRQIVARHFNAVVVYGGYHPFEWFLDYEGFDHATDKPADLRARNFDGLARFCAMAKRYGLRTFLHHYVSHFTQALADHLQLGLSETGARLAAFDHPVVEEYNRYIYRRTFETLPALDGLYMNFESSGDTIAFLRRTLLREAKARTRRPVLFFRLWGVTDVEGMKDLLGEYDGPKGLVHKSHDTNDVYYYPVADDRVRVWKRAMPDVEFAFSVGPCHNCGTNISQKLWTDPDYIHALLASIEQKGADSISFQSTRELLLAAIAEGERIEARGVRTEDGRESGLETRRSGTAGSRPLPLTINNYPLTINNAGEGTPPAQGLTALFPRTDHDHSRMNQGHLEAVVDYVRGRTPSRREWARRYAGWYGVQENAGEAIRAAIVESSQIILKQYRQFCYGSSQEGYLYPGRFSHYQEPFFYYPMAFLNRIGEIPHNVGWRSWAVRRRKIRVVPDDTQAPIDFVNPMVRRQPGNHPLAIARQIRRHIGAATRGIERYRSLAGEKTDAALVAAVRRNCSNGERVWREILIAIDLCACYFAKTRGAFFGHLRKARDRMRETARVLGEDLKDTDRFCSTTSNGPFTPEQDAAQIDAILAHEKDDFPFAALKAWLKSHERYNEIRRLCRPYVSVREQMAKRNRALLRQSLAAAERAAGLLREERYALLRDNVMAWVEYVRAEIDWLTPPAMACMREDAIGPDEGFRRMVHDQCYRWGERCWEDFSSFFVRQDFFREDVCDCRATHGDEGLTLSLREHGVDWPARKATWDANRGTVNQNGFMRVFLDPGNTGRRVVNYTIWFEGSGGTVGTFEEEADGQIRDGKPSPLAGCRTRFCHTDSSWRFDVTIPWKQLGGRPRPGSMWRLNILSNPAVKRNRQVAWCQAYEYRQDVARLGYIVFR